MLLNNFFILDGNGPRAGLFGRIVGPKLQYKIIGQIFLVKI